MASRPPHIPNSRERTVLQALLSNASDSKFHVTANPQTVESMVKKGWIIRTADGSAKLVITGAGKMALAQPF